MHSELRKARWLAAWLVGAYLAKMYVEMGWIKFDPEGFWTAAFAQWGYPPWFRVVIGVLEVGGGLCLVIPWVASYGAVALIVVMLGAWGTRALDGRWVDVGWLSLYAVALSWVAFEWWGTRLRLPRSDRSEPR